MKRIWIPQTVAICMLLAALFPGNPYGYYVLLRWVCCGVFAFFAVRAAARNQQGWVWILGITAAIYNPVFPAHLTRTMWPVVNIVTISIALASIFAIKGEYQQAMKITNIQQCMQQVVFAFKLKAAIESGSVRKEQIDKDVEVEGWSTPLPKDAFRCKGDMLILAENTVNMSLATLAIAADEELDLHFEHEHRGNAKHQHNIRAIIFQIRNAYAHNPLTPTWKVNNPQYLKKPYSYKSGQAQISLDFTRLTDTPLDYKHFNGFDHFWSLFDDAHKLVVSSRSDGT